MKFFPNKLIKSWAFYDFANSGYVLIFQSFLVPLFFSQVLLANGISKLTWGFANGFSTLLGVLLAIIVGRFADIKDRLRLFKYFIFVAFIFMLLFSFSVEHFTELSLPIFIITNSIFITTIAISDSLLTFLANNNNRNEYSGTAWGFGYLGGIICLIVVMQLQNLTSQFSQYVFAFVALFYYVFSLYALRGLERGKVSGDVSFNQAKDTTARIPRKRMIVLLIGYWLIAEAITVYILFYSYYASEEVKLSTTEVSISLLIVQVVAILFTKWGGQVADRMGNLKLLGYSVVIWVIIVLLMVSIPSKGIVLLVVILTGIVIGNSQSYLRAQYSSLVNKKTAGKEFGYFAIASQASVIVGPIFHGFLSDYFGSQKIPLLILAGTMIIGFALILYVSRKIYEYQNLGIREY